MRDSVEKYNLQSVGKLFRYRVVVVGNPRGFVVYAASTSEARRQVHRKGHVVRHVKREDADAPIDPQPQDKPMNNLLNQADQSIWSAIAKLQGARDLAPESRREEIQQQILALQSLSFCVRDMRDQMQSTTDAK